MAGYYVAFHGGKGRMMDRLVTWATRSQFAHCELLRADRRPRDGETHACIGASLMDGGVRQKRITFDPGKWRFVHVPWAPPNAWDRAMHHLERPYDLRAFVWTHLFNFRRQARDKWFCSELIAEAFDLNMPHAYSPGDLRRAVIDHNRTWQRGLRRAGRPPEMTRVGHFDAERTPSKRPPASLHPIRRPALDLEDDGLEVPG